MAVMRAGHTLPKVDWTKAEEDVGAPSTYAAKPGKRARTRMRLFSTQYQAYLTSLAPNTPKSPPHYWCGDSAATKHMCKDRELFTEYHPFNPPVLVTGAAQGMQARVYGQGTVTLPYQTPTGEINTLTLSNVLHIPQLHDNLMSLTRLDTTGHHMHLGHGRCIITKSGRAYGLGKLHQGFYILEYPLIRANRVEGPPDTFPAPAQSSPPTLTPSQLQHQRLGHPDFKVLSAMATKQLAQGLPPHQPPTPPTQPS